MDYQFNYLCVNGNLSEAKELLRDNPDINISARDDYAFRFACHQGHLEVINWLLSVKPDINISIYNEQAFRWACYKGHLKIAKWLLSVKPDINISEKNDYAFRSACYNGYLELAKFIQSLKPYLYVIIYDVNGKYIGFKIRRKEQVNWEKRKYALHLACQEETNILYHLPTDIVKAVTLFV
jgi:ankyrin repeat protein